MRFLVLVSHTMEILNLIPFMPSFYMVTRYGFFTVSKKLEVVSLLNPYDRQEPVEEVLSSFYLNGFQETETFLSEELLNMESGNIS